MLRNGMIRHRDPPTDSWHFEICTGSAIYTKSTEKAGRTGSFSGDPVFHTRDRSQPDTPSGSRAFYKKRGFPEENPSSSSHPATQAPVESRCRVFHSGWRIISFIRHSPIRPSDLASSRCISAFILRVPRSWPYPYRHRYRASPDRIWTPVSSFHRAG